MENVGIEISLLPHGRGLAFPEKATQGSSGVDLRAAIEDDVLIEPGQRVLVPTGLRVSIPQGYEWQIRPRSGLAIRYVANLGSEQVRIARGDRIAQAVLSSVASPQIVLVDELPETVRGEGGFGHSGM